MAESKKPKQTTNAKGEPTGSGSAGTPPGVADGTNLTPAGNPPVVAVDPKNDDGEGVKPPKKGKQPPTYKVSHG